jgi:hypothetical protein
VRRSWVTTFGLAARQAQCPSTATMARKRCSIIEGEGELRFGDKRYPIRKHDVIACPVRMSRTSHQHR